MESIKLALSQNTLALFHAFDEQKKRTDTLEQYLFGSQELWCVSLSVAGHMLAMRSREAAEQRAAEINQVSEGVETASVVSSPWPLDVHTAKAFEVLETWLAATDRTVSAQQIQIGRLKRHLASAKKRGESES